MRTRISIGLAMLSLLLLVTFGRTRTSQRPTPDGRITPVVSQRIIKAAQARRAASRTFRATQQIQPIHTALLAAVEAEADSDLRNEALERTVESISDADLPAMLDSLAIDANPGAAELSLLLVRRWAESDPPAAAAWTLRLPESPVSRKSIEQVAIAWASLDLAAATSWVHALSEGNSKQVATLGLAYEAARTEPVVAVELAGTLPPTLERDDLLVHAVSQWAETDPAMTAAWAKNVSDPILRQRLVASVAIVLAQQNAAAAAALIVNGLVAGEEQDRATVSIVQRWVQHSPRAAASWVAQFPDIPLRDVAVQNLLVLWTIKDPVAAGNWLDELPDGPLRDVGIATYSETMRDGFRTPVVMIPGGGM